VGCSTEKLLASMPEPVEPSAELAFCELVERRCAGVPVSYLRGVKEFYGRQYLVSPAVLVPRPQTELLVESALDAIDELSGRGRTGIRLHDAFTGSGCVALSVACERQDVEISGSDLDPAALRVAEANARRLVQPVRPGGPVEFFLSDFLAALDRRGARHDPDILTANPPYLTDDEWVRLEQTGWCEPALALKGGPDGLDPVRALAGQAVTRLAPGGYLLVEVGCDQADAVRAILTRAGFVETRVLHDLGGLDRVVGCRVR